MANIQLGKTKLCMMYCKFYLLTINALGKFEITTCGMKLTETGNKIDVLTEFLTRKLFHNSTIYGEGQIT